ncbi:MAG TPA: fibronectin type III domain-containing protein, partial [Desulfobacteria bacterium]|nr:fibronectin type III domain-containing protein [Desulfobacteria bacterium]
MGARSMIRILSCFLILAGIAMFIPIPAAGLTLLPGDLIVRPEIPDIVQPGIDIPLIEPDLILKTLPAAPTELALTVTSTAITLSWKDNAVDETGYKIERSLGVGQWNLLPSLAANTT